METFRVIMVNELHQWERFTMPLNYAGRYEEILVFLKRKFDFIQI